MAAFATPLVYSAYVNGLIEQASNTEFRHMARAARELLHREFGLTQCDWSDEWCDCKETATTHDLESEQEFCLRHFNMVQKARR